MIRSLGICQSSESFAVYEKERDREDQATNNKKKRKEKLPFNEPDLNII